MIDQIRAFAKSLLNYIKYSLRIMFRWIGFEIHRINVKTNKSSQFYAALDFFNIDLIFDVGANTGQFAKEIRRTGFAGRIISFEPIPEAYAKLKRRAICDKFWTIHGRCALGSQKGKAIINVSKNSVSSSILPILEASYSVAPETIYIAKAKVNIITLDSVSEKYLSNSNNYFIKIDTQGFEWQVLNGAKKTLENAKGVLCELSLVSLYKGQKMWIHFIHRMEKEGFSLWQVQQVFLDPKNGRTLQIDAIFFRK